MVEGTLDRGSLLSALSQPILLKLSWTLAAPSVAKHSLSLCAALGSGSPKQQRSLIRAASPGGTPWQRLPPEYALLTFLLASGVHGGPTRTPWDASGHLGKKR